MADFFDRIISFAKDKAIEVARHDEHFPTLFLLTDDAVQIAEIPPEVPPRDALPVWLDQQQPDAYILIVEARILSGVKPEDLDDFQYGDIGNNPDNPTILSITAARRGGEVKMLIAEVQNEDFPREFQDWREMDGATGVMAIQEW